ncbi:hydroxyacylglutathione hydrolase [Microbulbifer thermotolerans]|uniref:hydroxyacylglutathione hydrolase n=1 Tax=Microbulbifer thermotolerans TaxID=252514 RepID=UPI0022496553|nr:hydroxyacylglutathione hydrolase [Microbulbifer thermotolerans]MCX2779584.1 hydroxyacylglutathione hydrolase [Microbulbifer thermotolerans]MCX2804985.1 hydroxyacylglutathione hydrolase [Microbulbifer thermotolerans]MCX2831651.1 hydroxyacylglutathione hydrolase [Microbulbifer thermotolerans]MCX2833942.1 hydroxyacylglutathione hydrolase [Microbulbifer thermotolerans]MCX2841967.1 hydroxyacylglutathione hydrolase [Microbulbifer thermotolerans]
MLKISPIPAFSDNYIWHLTRGDEHWVVDPGDARPVIEALGDSALSGILITHHHLDHTGGVAQLSTRFQCPVYGPASIKGVTEPLTDGDQRELLGLPLRVMAVPGHTLDHLALLLEEENPGGAPRAHLFCGDTLFAAGCGRLFEGTPAQMYASLSKLGALPPETKVYCAHEYTLANLRFAEAAEPGNTAIVNRLAEAEALRANDRPTLPSTIGEELATNPFLRCHIPAVARRALNHGADGSLENPDEVQVFTLLRSWKDNF